MGAKTKKNPGSATAYKDEEQMSVQKIIIKIAHLFVSCFFIFAVCTLDQFFLFLLLFK